MERKFVAVVLVVVLVGLSATLGAWAWFPRIRSPPEPASAVHITFDSGQVGGEPGMNTSTIWTARITSVSTNETLDSYKAALAVNATWVVSPVVVARGTLATVDDGVFEFFEEGSYCSPIPCPPPEGPDGLLGVGDYFRISDASAGTAYTIQVSWAETGEVVGQISIQT